MTTVAKKLYNTMCGPPRLSFSVLKPALLSSLFQRVVPRRLTVTFHKVFVGLDVFAFELCVQVRKGCLRSESRSVLERCGRCGDSNHPCSNGNAGREAIRVARLTFAALYCLPLDDLPSAQPAIVALEDRDDGHIGKEAVQSRRELLRSREVHEAVLRA